MYPKCLIAPSLNPPKTISLNPPGALTADIVELEVKRSLEWLLAAERVEARRYAAVLILR
jgi:hypothetical protein